MKTRITPVIAMVTGVLAVLVPVQVVPAEEAPPTGMADQIPVRGVIRPDARAELSSDIGAEVVSIGFDEGESFDQGDVLIAFDCRKPEAQLAASRAQLKEAEANLRSATVLKNNNAGSRQGYESALARRNRGAAEVTVAELIVEHCALSAPFDGKVETLFIQPHETPAPGKPMISILSDRAPTIELIVPSAWLTWISAGTPFEFLIDETGATAEAEVTRLGAAIDAVSQTAKIYARFKIPPDFVLPGMSGTANFVLPIRGGFNG